MSILLINPPRTIGENNIWRGINSCTPPLGLALLAAILEKAGISCDIFDGEAEDVSLNDIVSRARTYYFVGITATTASIDSAIKIAKAIKKTYPGVQIIFGGVHPSIYYKEMMDDVCIDYIIRNEGEGPLLMLLGGKDKETIPNLSWRDGAGVWHNSGATKWHDIGAQPFLAYHKLQMGKYHSALGSYKRKPSLGMITSRGCPGRCTFCYSGMFGQKIRQMPAQRIVDEIIYLKDFYGIREISFYDDTFTSDRKNVMELCRLLKDKDITWSCFARVDTVDAELLGAMKSAGCHQIMYGIESCDGEILKSINKRVSPERNELAVKMTQAAGIDVRGAFMLGSPGETEETMKNTTDYAIKLAPDIAIFNITTPYPGTAMYAWAKENGYLLTEKWEDYDLAHPIMNLPTVAPEVVGKYYKLAYRRFYRRANYVWRKMLKIRTWEDIQMYFAAFFAILKVNKKKERK